jgi:2,6-dihydroxypyridine 3-monooxygenase
MASQGMPRVAIAGGSLAGLTAALLLRDAGCEVDVYERSAGPLHSFGAGVIMHASTSRYFVERTDIPLEDLSIPARTLQYLRRDGSREHSRPIDYRLTSWNSIYRGLLTTFGRERYHQGHALVGFDQDADGVDVRFASGHTARCDLLVCADGVQSTGRKRLFPDAATHYSGYVGWRGILSEEDVAPETWEALDGVFTYQVLEDSHAVAYAMPTIAEDSVHVVGRRVNYTWYVNVPAGPEYDELMTDREGIARPLSVHPLGVQTRFIDEMRAAAREQLAPPLADIVTSKAHDPFLTAIVDCEVPALHSGRVCLIGDAGFTARPHAAAGAAKGAETAWALARAMVDSEGDVPAALAAMEPPMMELGRALLERTRDMGARLQFGGPWEPSDPSLRFGLYGPDR